MIIHLGDLSLFPLECRRSTDYPRLIGIRNCTKTHYCHPTYKPLNINMSNFKIHIFVGMAHDGFGPIFRLRLELVGT